MILIPKERNPAEAINNDLKDINYEDVLILYYEGYTGTRADASPEDYKAYVDACKRIFYTRNDTCLLEP